MIEVVAAELLRCALPLVRPFRTSFGIQHIRNAVLLHVEARVDGRDTFGWGECVAMAEPTYSEEHASGAWAVMRDFLLPLAHRAPLEGPEDIAVRFAPIKGNRMAKAAVEIALLDAWLRAQDRSLADYLGGVRDRIECGVSVGLAPSADELLEEVGRYVDQGYRRVKLKVAPGEDASVLTPVREAFPTLRLMADANGSYSLDDLPALKGFDAFDLMMIEQPLAEDDLLGHALLAASIRTPVCLDESVRSAKEAADAISMGACSILSIKAGHVGGLLEARRVHDLARDAHVPVWCGGMFETGIGRAANLALASLEGFTLPGDTSASDRYFHEDITEPFVLAADGTLPVPRGPGIGVEPRDDMLVHKVRDREIVRP